MTTPLPVARQPLDARTAVTVVRPATPAKPVASSPDIATQVATQVTGGMLSASQGQSLAEFFDADKLGGDTSGGAAPVRGNLMRTANDQLDQFDRVLEKLRANFAGGATYGAAAVARTGLVVDRLA